MGSILVTGAFGNVGRSTLAALSKRGVDALAFDCPSRANLRTARRDFPGLRVAWGDVRDHAALERAVASCPDGLDALIHLAAVIPPAADRNPACAESVNVGGTAAVLEVLKRFAPGARLVYTSSIATYGDRLGDWLVRPGDPQRPQDDDPYAVQKTAAEARVRASELDWVVCRLSYVVWKRKTAMDPLMFRMPLGTRVEVVHTEDCGEALAAACFSPEAARRVFDIAGGESCRTIYGDYLDRMLAIFGLGGRRFLPEKAFARKGYHCAWVDTAESQKVLRFQKRSLEDYYAEVREEAKGLRFWAALVRPLVRAAIKARSPFLAASRAAARALRKTGAPAAAV
ncbi:MAG: NAD(P)-dependent oxidoreductase [Spirochaetales bacterium]|nr:NAD(P)-dependent oxidoreductase [Spirochaetales bacterium]